MSLSKSCGITVLPPPSSSQVVLMKHPRNLDSSAVQLNSVFLGDPRPGSHYYCCIMASLCSIMGLRVLPFNLAQHSQHRQRTHKNDEKFPKMCFEPQNGVKCEMGEGTPKLCFAGIEVVLGTKMRSFRDVQWKVGLEAWMDSLNCDLKLFGSTNSYKFICEL